MSRASRRRILPTIGLAIGCLAVLPACQTAAEDQPTATSLPVLDSCAHTTTEALNGLANDVNAGDAKGASKWFAPASAFLGFGDFPDRWFNGRPSDRESLPDYLQAYVDNQTVLTIDVDYAALGRFGLTFSRTGSDGIRTARGRGAVDCETGLILDLVFGMTEAEVNVGYDSLPTSTMSPSAAGASTPTEKYTACVAAAGIDVGGAQPVYDQAGALTWMKTGVDVPVDIHSACFEFVGGTGVSLTTSSWGN